MGLDWNFGNFSKSQVSYIQKTDNFKKLKFILSKYDTFTDIYNEYIKLFRDTNRKVFDMVVFNYSLKNLQKLLEDFMRYNGLKNSYVQDKSLFNSLYSKIKNVVYEEKEEIKKESHQKYFLIQSFADLINALMEVIEVGAVNSLAKKDLVIRAYSMVDKKEELSLYLQGKSPKTPDVFWSLKHLQSYVEKRIATYDMYDYILKHSKDDPSKRELLDLVLAVNNFNKTDFDLYFKNKLTDIEKIMQIEEDLQELAIDYERIDNYQPTKSGNKKSYHDIYALFLGNLENDLDKRKELEEFLAKQKPEGIALIKLYIINKLESKDLKMKARNYIYFLKNKFLNDKNEKIKKQRLTKYKNVYEYILKDKAYDELERLYLDEMLGQEKEDILNLIKAYFDGSLTKANKTKVVNKLSKIRAKYELFKENNIPISELNKKHNFANIYEYILREDADNLEKRKIVDNLLLKLSEEDQKNIRLYYEDKLDDHEKRYITQRRLSYLRYKYKETLNSSNKQTFKSKSRKRASDIYEYILKDEANNLENRKILDEILCNEPEERLKRIELYFEGKLKAREVGPILNNIKQKYENRVVQKLARRKKSQDIYEYVLKEEVNNLEKRKNED